MSADYTTTGLIANTKRRGFVPAGSGLTTSDILQILSEQLRNYIPSFLKGLREEFIVAQLSVPVTAQAVPIPARACGVALRTIGWMDSAGHVRPLVRIEPERRHDWNDATGLPRGFMFQGNNALLFPAATTGTLVVSYQQRPGQLVLTTDCALVTGNAGGGILNVVGAGLPASLVVGAQVDIASGAPNFGLRMVDAEITSISVALPTSIIEVDGDSDSVVAGDFICLASETCVPQIPLECFDLLAQAAALEICQSNGSTRLQAVKDGLKDLREQVAMILSPRADGTSRPIINRSRLGRW